MSEQNELTCPRCHGEKLLAGWGSTTSGKRMRVKLACNLCDGTGLINEEKLKWISIGKALQRIRIDKLQVGLRNFAVSRGLLPSIVAAWENGRVDNTSPEILPLYEQCKTD